MGSVSTINPGVASLLQTLSNVSPALSSPAVQSALENASPQDVVQLSEAATQLESVDAMFGVPSSSSTASPLNLEALLTGSAGAATASPDAASNALSSSPAVSTASSPDQLANYQTALQAQVTQGLFDPGGTGTPSGSLSNVIG
jgi:hypothetical protein